MNHRRFETWLLNDERLTPEDDIALQTHLRACASCAALAEANRTLRAAVMAEPAAGFVGRFQSRLAAEKEAQRKRIFLGSLTLLFAGLGLGVWLTLPLLPSLQNLFRSPAQVLASWTLSAIGLFTSLQAFGEAGAVFLRVFGALMPEFIWPLLAFSLTGLSVVWMFSVRRITRFAARSVR